VKFNIQLGTVRKFKGGMNLKLCKFGNLMQVSSMFSTQNVVSHVFSYTKTRSA